MTNEVSPITQAIDVKLIVVPEEMKRSIDWKTEKNTVFLDSFHRRQINPINVRRMTIKKEDGTIEATDKFELVCGLKRLGAAKKLGHKTIDCKIENWTDAELGYLRMVENVHRTQLTPAREALANQKLLAAFAVMFGKDPQKADNNMEVREKQSRVGGKFGPVAQHEKAAESTEEVETEASPSSAESALDGGEAKSQPEATSKKSREKAFTQVLSDVTGKSMRASQIAKVIAEKICAAELEILERANVTSEQLYRIARVEPADERSAVVAMIAFGKAFDDAIKEVKENPEVGEVRKEYLSEVALTDAQWIEHYCGKFRSNLQNPLTFDQDATVYRNTRSARAMFRKQAEDVVLELRMRKYTPATDILHKAMHMEHPGSWLACPDCMGKNLDKPDCRGCLGYGYRVQYHPAKMVRR